MTAFFYGTKPENPRLTIDNTLFNRVYYKRGDIMLRNKNDFVRTKQDLTHLTWSDKASSSGTNGLFLKTFENNIHYKLSNYDSYRGFFGHECVNELVASRLLDVLGIDHLSYRLIHAEVCVDGTNLETWLCSSRNFKRRGEKKLAMETYYSLNSLSGESPIDFCERIGWADQIYKMMLVDFLIANRDRHGANIEVLGTTTGNYRLAPLFDHGVSFLFSTYGDENIIRDFDIMKDMPVNNYFGTRSLFNNLEFIPQTIQVNPVTEHDYAYIFRGLDGVVSPLLIGKMREMIERRWNYFEKIRNR